MEFSFQGLSWNKLCEEACAAQRPRQILFALCSVAGHSIVLMVMVPWGNFLYFFPPRDWDVKLESPSMQKSAKCINYICKSFEVENSTKCSQILHSLVFHAFHTTCRADLEEYS